jgi:ATP-dependent RNA helicase HelY
MLLLNDVQSIIRQYRGKMKYRGLVLDGFQKEAIEALKVGESVLVAAPTGTGKTLVADWIVEKAMNENKFVVYTAPIKALSNQKYRDYCNLFGEENVGLITGDLVIRRDAPCKVMTTEILRNMLLCDDSIDDLLAVIVDEIHFLDDRDRGTTWEEMLIYLPKEVQIVGLSATLANLHEFADWLSSVRQRKVRVVEEYKRAVPLTYRIATKEGGLCTLDKASEIARKDFQQNQRKKHSRGKKRYSRHKEKRNRAPSTTHIDVFKMMKGQNWPYLYFVFSRARTEILARDLGNWLHDSLLTDTEVEDVNKRLENFMRQPGSETAMTPKLAKLYRFGIAFHHAGLHVMLKSFVEELYEKRLIKVLYCTGTFALGINMPAKSAVFDSLQRYDGNGMIPLPTREFMQMAGRAGRRGLDDEGLVVMRLNLDEVYEFKRQIKSYLSSSYEPVHSRFSLSFNSVVNLLHRNPAAQIRRLVELSFLSWHRQRVAERERKRATQMVQELEAAGFQVSVGKKGLKRQQKEIHRKFNKAEDIENRTWSEFEMRVQFLEMYDYIKPDGTFNAGAHALMHFQIQEVFMSELFLLGELDKLSAPMLYGVLCGLVVDLPRGVQVFEAKKYKGFSKQIASVYKSDIIQDSAYITRQQLVWEPKMIPIGKAWAEGVTLAEILFMVSSDTDVSGTLVGAFRRAKDLLTQLRNAWKGFPEKTNMVNSLLRSVSRDEVEVVD